MLNNLIDILIAPNQVFGRLKEKPAWFLPWLLVFLMTASVQLGFFSLVDSEYLLNQLVEQSLQPGIAERDLRATLQVQVDNKSLLIVSSVVGVFIGLLLIMAIKAAIANCQRGTSMRTIRAGMTNMEKNGNKEPATPNILVGLFTTENARKNGTIIKSMTGNILDCASCGLSNMAPKAENILRVARKSLSAIPG